MISQDILHSLGEDYFIAKGALSISLECLMLVWGNPHKREPTEVILRAQ